MINRLRIQTILSSLLIIFTLFVSQLPVRASTDSSTALFDYVNTPDNTYDYQHFISLPGPGFTSHIFSMNSQQWRSASEIDRSTWSHWIIIAVPDTVSSDTSMLIIDGDRNRDFPRLDSSALQISGQLALTSQSIVSVVSQVPNQPFNFPDQPTPLTEDYLVAYSWDKAMVTNDSSWHVYLPMVKSVVRAMDTIQAVTPLVAQKTINDFVLTGFSKRGIITWLTGTVDTRVKAINPGVIDFLNMAPHFEHHFQSYGFYSPYLQPYLDFDIARRVRTPEGLNVLKAIDPYYHLEKLSMPKFMLNAPGDQFFPSDSARHYFQNLSGENLIRYVPNTGHTLKDANGSTENALVSLFSWYLNILYDVPRPQISWQKINNQLTVTTFPPAASATLWQADNASARDFRKDTIANGWSPTPLQSSGNGIYQMHFDQPTNGWRAYYAEFSYPGAGGLPQTYSTRVFITPDTLPFELSDAIGDPKGKGFWKKQLKVATTGTGNNKVDPELLTTYFPVPIFNQTINTIENAYELFSTKEKSSDNKALQHCLALRLNIKHQELGWYSYIETDNDDHHDKYQDRDDSEERTALWQLWQTAHDAFLAGKPKVAKEICEEINEI